MMNHQISTRFYDALDIALAFVTLEAVRVPESKLSPDPDSSCCNGDGCESGRRRSAADRSRRPAGQVRPTARRAA